MTGLAGGGYPTGYRNKGARELSMASRPVREPEVLEPTKPKRPRPGITGWKDLVNANQLPVTTGGKEIIYLPGFNANDILDAAGSIESGVGWKEREKFKQFFGPDGNTITLTKKEYRDISEAIKQGNRTKWFRMLWKIFRNITRNKDIRLELVSRLLEALFMGSGADDFGLQSAQEIFPSGWTVTGMCPTAKPTFDSKAVWRNVENPCLPLQAAIGRDGVGPFLETRGMSHWSTAQFRWLYGKWESVSNDTRASHWRSAWTPWQYWGLNPIGSINDETIKARFPQFARPSRAFVPSQRWHPAPHGSARPGTRTRPSPYKPDVTEDKLPRKEKDKKFVIAFNNTSWYGQIVNGVTEMVDIVDILYDSLGKKCGARTPQDKISCIHANWSTIDWGAFLVGLAENQIEDYVWGSIGQMSADAANTANRPTGWQLGPWDTEFAFHTNGGLQIRMSS